MTDFYRKQLEQAALLPDHELARHALVSSRNHCNCFDCFCCACLQEQWNRERRRVVERAERKLLGTRDNSH